MEKHRNYRYLKHEKRKWQRTNGEYNKGQVRLDVGSPLLPLPHFNPKLRGLHEIAIASGRCFMKITHHGIQLGELRDDWWSEAKMDGFVPGSRAYGVSSTNEQIVEVSIEDVSPLLRKPLFRDNIDEGESVANRVVSILRGLRLGAAFPPVEIALGEAPYRYRLVAGAHRFYCSLAVGFTHVPAIIRLDWQR